MLLEALVRWQLADVLAKGSDPSKHLERLDEAIWQLRDALARPFGDGELPWAQRPRLPGRRRRSDRADDATRVRARTGVKP
jgi:hypothetical protein